MKKLILFILSILIFVATQAQRSGKDYALFFAVNQYEKMTILQNPVKNAKDIAQVLEERFGFTTEVITNPSFEDIEKKINAYKSLYANGRYPSDGQLLIFFSGHGVKRGNNGYFMPKDADPGRPYATAIEYDYWRSEIDRINCKHILVCIDACHSVSFDPKWQARNDREFTRPGEQYTDQVLKNHKAYRARLFFTSDAKGNETPDRSTFAAKLLEGLRTHPSTATYLTSSELFASYMKKAAPTPGGGDFGSDDPGSTFLFFPKQQPVSVNLKAERDAWQQAKNTNTLLAYRQFIQRFPNGDFSPLANAAIKKLEQEDKELRDWDNAKQTNTAQAYQQFLNNHPNSIYADVASLKLKDSKGADLDKMVYIQGGKFQMGSNDSDAGSNEKPVHEVTVSSFYMSRIEVTVDDFAEFVTATNYQTDADKGGWSYVWTGSTYERKNGVNWKYDAQGKVRPNKDYNHPVIHVSWNDAVAYCNWLSNQQGFQEAYTIRGDQVTVNWNANGYRLPTEAEWEFAARSRGKDEKWAGTSTEISLADYGNYYDGGSKDGYEYTASVKSFKPNALGLYDMSGNVWEWCWDWYASDYYKNSPSSNPKGASKGSLRVLRGGSWYNNPSYLRCSYRSLDSPSRRNCGIGFRLSRAGL